MAAAVDEITVKGTSSILGWYDKGRPMWIDLVGDYAGRELFLVEGDSLLRECFEDKRIDFHGNLTRVCPTFLFGLEWRPLSISRCVLLQTRWLRLQTLVLDTFPGRGCPF